MKTHKPTQPGPPPNFTKRQTEIIRQWAESESAEEASRKLKISKHTYQTHLKRMRLKLGVNRTFNVYQFMSDKGLV